MGLASSNATDLNDVFEDIKRGILQQFIDMTLEKQVSRADFKIIQTLSNRNSTHCYLVEKKDTKERFVMKVMEKFTIYNKGCIPNVLKEIKILSKVQHSFIIHLKYAFQDYSSLYYVCEFVRAGDLSFQMKFHQSFDEAETTIEKLHALHYVIVGLTIDHILLDQRGYPRIIGFMDSIKLKEKQTKQKSFVLHDDLITEYLAPEVLMRQTPSYEADYYSLGMIMYEMMEGRKGIHLLIIRQGVNQEVMTRQQLIQNILSREKQVKKSDLPEGWSLDSADFINKLIKKKTTNRLGYYSIDELKKHGWLKGVAWQRIEDCIMNPPYVPRIRKIESESIFTKQTSVVYNQRPQYSEKIQELFNSLDFQEKFEKYYYSIEDDDNNSENNGNQQGMLIIDGQTDIQDIVSDKKLLS